MLVSRQCRVNLANLVESTNSVCPWLLDNTSHIFVVVLALVRERYTSTSAGLITPMRDLPIQRLRRALSRFCRDIDVNEPVFSGVMPLINKLGEALERIQVDNILCLRGRRPVVQTCRQLRRHIYYLNKKSKTLREHVRRMRRDHNFFVSTFWTVQAGLSDPKTSHRSVESWCRDMAVLCREFCGVAWCLLLFQFSALMHKCGMFLYKISGRVLQKACRDYLTLLCSSHPLDSSAAPTVTAPVVWPHLYTVIVLDSHGCCCDRSVSPVVTAPVVWLLVWW